MTEASRPATRARWSGGTSLGAMGLALAAPAATALGAILVAWAADATGTFHDMVATLVVIGFSPDRSELIASLAIEAIAVGIATFAVPRRLSAILAGVAAVALLYHRTFDAETRSALHASGVQGTFDPFGWALTLASLLVTAIVIAWSVATLIGIARNQVVRAARDLASIRTRGLGRRTLGRPAAVGIVAIVLATTMPVLGDMLNYEPNLDMTKGGPGVIGLTQNLFTASLPAGLPSIPPTLLADGGVVGPLAQAGVTPPASVLSMARPWLAWRPTGSGRLIHLVVPAPFGPAGSTTIVEVYLPAGYDASTRHYPVLYEVPWGVSSWQKGVNIQAMLDALISSGAIPPTIAVFSRESGGPYADTECANSVDGKVWYESWLVQTVVPAIDATYRTIPNRAARAVLGFSQGGFCAPMFVLKDSSTFGTAISYSGYFQAGIRSSQTVNAWIPFGGNPAYEARFSPFDLAPQVPSAVRPYLFFELSANPTGPFYGPQYVGFGRALEGAGLPFALFPTPLGHAWAAVRQQLPEMLTTWGERMTALSVFAT